MSEVVLRVDIEDWDPLVGTVGLFGSGTGARFEGWISFMAAIDQFCPHPFGAYPNGDEDR